MTDPTITPEIRCMEIDAERIKTLSYARSYTSNACDDLLLAIHGDEDRTGKRVDAAIACLRIAAELLGYTLTPK